MSERGSRFIQNLIADYQNAAQYWRMVVALWRRQLEQYNYMPEEVEAQEKEIAFAEATVREMEAHATQLRGGKGEELSDPISQLPERHTEQLQKITCTTVL